MVTNGSVSSRGGKGNVGADDTSTNGSSRGGFNMMGFMGFGGGSGGRSTDGGPSKDRGGRLVSATAACLPMIHPLPCLLTGTLVQTNERTNERTHAAIIKGPRGRLHGVSPVGFFWRPWFLLDEHAQFRRVCSCDAEICSPDCENKRYVSAIYHQSIL